MIALMASRNVVIPFPVHRVRRYATRRPGSRMARQLQAQHEAEELEQAQLRLFAWCFAAAAAITTVIAIVF